MTPNTDPLPGLNTTPCDTFAELVGRVLDGELPTSSLDDAHTVSCPDCAGIAAATRDLQSYSTREIARPLVPTARFQIEVAEAARQRFRRDRRLRHASRFALAACLLIAVGLGIRYTGSSSTPGAVAEIPATNPDPLPPPAPPAGPDVAVHLADAGEALAALTRQTTERAAAPTRTLLASANRLTLPAPQPVEPVVFPDLPDAARTGFEPVASTTRRAYDLFVRDFGIAPARQR